jgi:hypothetical protein
MKIEKCVGGFYAVSMKSTEEINLRDITRCLKNAGITSFRPKKGLNFLQTHSWNGKRTDNKIKLDFRQNKNQYLMTVLVSLLNSWGWSCIIMEDGIKEKFIFERPEIFFPANLFRILKK